MSHLKTLSYRLYTMDGKFTEAARGEVTLELRSGMNSETPIVGTAMTMEGSSALDPVLIPSGCRGYAGGTQMHVRLRGDGNAVNSFIGEVKGTLNSNARPISFHGEYRHVGQPFGDLLGTTWKYFYMLAQQNDVAWDESLSPQCDAEGNWSLPSEREEEA